MVEIVDDVRSVEVDGQHPQPGTVNGEKEEAGHGEGRGGVSLRMWKEGGQSRSKFCKLWDEAGPGEVAVVD